MLQLQGMLLQEGLSASATTRRVHVPVSWALSRMDQVMTNPTSFAVFIPLFVSSISVLSPLVLTFWPQALLFELSYIFFSVTSDLHRHFGTTSAVLITKTRTSRHVIVTGYVPRPMIYWHQTTASR